MFHLVSREPVSGVSNMYARWSGNRGWEGRRVSKVLKKSWNFRILSVKKVIWIESNELKKEQFVNGFTRVDFFKLKKMIWLRSNLATSDICWVWDESSAAWAWWRSASEPSSALWSAVQQLQHVRAQSIHFIWLLLFKIKERKNKLQWAPLNGIAVNGIIWFMGSFCKWDQI